MKNYLTRMSYGERARAGAKELGLTREPRPLSPSLLLAVHIFAQSLYDFANQISYSIYVFVSPPARLLCASSSRSEVKGVSAVNMARFRNSLSQLWVCHTVLLHLRNSITLCLHKHRECRFGESQRRERSDYQNQSPLTLNYVNDLLLWVQGNANQSLLGSLILLSAVGRCGQSRRRSLCEIRLIITSGVSPGSSREAARLIATRTRLGPLAGGPRERERE